MKTAISYLRFSSMLQASGDSFRRQSTSRDQWLKNNPEVKLEKELNDFGLSAFKAHHVSKGDLGDFLEFIKTPSFAERIERDEIFLLVESLDRLSREKIMTALNQLKAIVEAGVKVVTLADGQTYDKESLNDLGGLIVAIVTMSRAYNESKTKSVRIKEAFKKKRDDARSGKVYRKNPPPWLEVVDGKYEIIEENARIIRGIIADIAQGKSIADLVRDLEGVPTINMMKGVKVRSKQWSPTSIRDLISFPTAIGTLTLKDGIVEDHYPAIVSKEIFAKARQVISNNLSDRGRKSKTHVNMFRKFATDPEGEPIYLKSRGRGSYLPRSAHRGKWFEGATWHQEELETIVIHTMRLALKVEVSTKGEEAKLAKVKEDIRKIEKKIQNLEQLLEDEPDKGLLKRKKEREIERDALKEDARKIQDDILAGGQKTILDPMRSTRDEIAQALRANIKTMIIDFKKRTLFVRLNNGIEYQASIEEGVVIVETNDFELPQSFKLADKNRISGE